MTQAIYKYDIDLHDSNQFEMPIGAKPLSVGVQDREIKLWVLCNPTNDKEMRGVYILPTGEHGEGFPEVCEDAYVGSVLTHNDAYVWHIFMD